MRILGCVEKIYLAYVSFDDSLSVDTDPDSHLNSVKGSKVRNSRDRNLTASRPGGPGVGRGETWAGAHLPHYVRVTGSVYTRW